MISMSTNKIKNSIKVVYLLFSQSTQTVMFDSTTESIPSNRFSNAIMVIGGSSSFWYFKVMYDQTQNSGTGRWVIIDQKT